MISKDELVYMKELVNYVKDIFILDMNFELKLISRCALCNKELDVDKKYPRLYFLNRDGEIEKKLFIKKSGGIRKGLSFCEKHSKKQILDKVREIYTPDTKILIKNIDVSKLEKKHLNIDNKDFFVFMEDVNRRYTDKRNKVTRFAISEYPHSFLTFLFTFADIIFSYGELISRTDENYKKDIKQFADIINKRIGSSIVPNEKSLKGFLRHFIVSRYLFLQEIPVSDFGRRVLLNYFNQFNEYKKKDSLRIELLKLKQQIIELIDEKIEKIKTKQEVN